MLTGTLTAQVNADGTLSSTDLYSVMYYDNRGRVIQTKSNNPLADGIEQEYLAYDFVGNVTQRKHVHQAAGKTMQAEIYQYEYDHAGRLLTTTHQLNDGVKAKLSDNVYDELGRLKTDKRNGNAKLNDKRLCYYSHTLLFFSFWGYFSILIIIHLLSMFSKLFYTIGICHPELVEGSHLLRTPGEKIQ